MRISDTVSGRLRRMVLASALASSLIAAGCGSVDLDGPEPVGAAGALRPGASSSGFELAAPGFAWSFPEDHWAHRSYRNEWWYFTGHLRSEHAPPREFGFQFTLFRIGLRPQAQPFDSEWKTAGLIMGHASVVDKQSGEHRFSEVLYRESELLGSFPPFEGDPTGEIAWVLGPAGTEERWTLSGLDPGFALRMADRRQELALRLQAVPGGPAVLQGPGGFSSKDDRGVSGSLYYSFPRLELQGELEFESSPIAVRGLGWMDKEFSSNHLDEAQVGWDWFSLQFEDGRNLMLFRLRRADGTQDFASGTSIGADRRARYLTAAEIRMRPGRAWRSPETGYRYPVEWELELPGDGLRLKIRAAVDGQENRSRARGGLAYWEGAVEISDLGGARLGRGYLEMTGYGKDNRPPI